MAIIRMLKHVYDTLLGYILLFYEFVPVISVNLWTFYKVTIDLASVLYLMMVLFVLPYIDDNQTGFPNDYFSTLQIFIIFVMMLADLAFAIVLSAAIHIDSYSGLRAFLIYGVNMLLAEIGVFVYFILPQTKYSGMTWEDIGWPTKFDTDAQIVTFGVLFLWVDFLNLIVVQGYLGKIRDVKYDLVDKLALTSLSEKELLAYEDLDDEMDFEENEIVLFKTENEKKHLRYLH